MDFFNDCKTQEEAKSTFKRLCKHFHPDKGGEESLMIELKKQYDDWKPSYEAHNFNMKFTRHSNLSLDSVYEQKISELNGLVHRLRSEIDILTIGRSFDRDSYNAQVRIQRGLEIVITDLNTQLKENKQELIQERDKHKNRSLADKIKTVFGYE